LSAAREKNLDTLGDSKNKFLDGLEHSVTRETKEEKAEFWIISWTKTVTETVDRTQEFKSKIQEVDRGIENENKNFNQMNESLQNQFNTRSKHLKEQIESLTNVINSEAKNMKELLTQTENKIMGTIEAIKSSILKAETERGEYVAKKKKADESLVATNDKLKKNWN